MDSFIAGGQSGVNTIHTNIGSGRFLLGSQKLRNNSLNNIGETKEMRIKKNYVYIMLQMIWD